MRKKRMPERRGMEMDEGKEVEVGWVGEQRR